MWTFPKKLEIEMVGPFEGRDCTGMYWVVLWRCIESCWDGGLPKNAGTFLRAPMMRVNYSIWGSILGCPIRP